MTKSVIDLAAVHLKRQFLYQTQRGRFGGLDALLELAISARACTASSMSAGRIVVAFVLERVLDQCADDLEGRPVPISETADLAERFHQPVARAVDYLVGGIDDPIEVSEALIKARAAQHR